MAIKQEFTLPSGIGVSAHKIYIVSSTDSNSVDIGALITPGGAGVGKSLSVGGTLQLFNGSNFTALKSSAVSDTIYTLPASYPATGTSVLQSDTSGNLLWVPMVASGSGGGAGTVSLGTQYQIAYYSGTAATVVGSASFTNNTATNTVSINHTTSSSGTTTGALVVAGGVGIGGTVNIAGDETVFGRLSYTQSTVGIAGTTVTPQISFIGQDNNPITLSVLSDNTLSFEGSSGQLFSINNNLSSGTIFSVNDISGLPIIRANANGTLSMGEYSGNVGIGLSLPSYKLHVAGDTNLSSGYVYRINGTSVLSNSSLGIGITNSSLTAVGTINTGVWAGTLITAFYGGTGYNSYTKGDILVGAGNTFIKLNVGADNYVLTASSASESGLVWSPTSATGITTLNSLTTTEQYFAVGTSGNLFNISSSGSTHTFNIPIAGVGSTGLVSTQSQSFSGIKTFTEAVNITDNTGSSLYTNGALVVTGGVGIGGTLNVQGDLNVQGTFTTINSTVLTVADKNIEIGTVGTPSDITAHQGGIVLKGATDKTLFWYSGVGWSSSESINLVAGNSYKINGTSVLSNNTLGSDVIFSSIQTAGIITSGTWSATAITAFYGGTGYNSYTKGDILVGAGNTFIKLNVGTDNYVLTASSTSSTGLTWSPTAATGITTLNSLTATEQYFSTGASGTGFNISSSGSTHTFNIPIASTGSTGLVSTLAQSFAGVKTFTNDVIISSSTASTSMRNGALQVYGGVGISGQLSFNQAAVGFTGILTNPSIAFIGTTGSPITLSVLQDNSLSFEGSSGQLFSIDNNLTSGEIFAVSDISGLPIISAYANQNVSIGEFGGNLGVGLSNPSYKLHVIGSVGFTSNISSTSTTSGTLVVSGGVGIGGSLYVNSASAISGVRIDSGIVYGDLSGTATTANYAHQSGYAITSGTASTSGFATTASYAYQSGYGLTAGIANSSYSSFINTSNANSSHPLIFAPISGSSSGAGLSINTILNYNPSSNILYTSGLAITANTASSSTSNGALTVAGGVGISGRLSFNQAAFGTTGISSNPTIAMIGSTGDPIYLSVLEDNTISFEGSQGQLFSITPNLSTGYIYSVNDITGIPLLRANANANVTANEYAGNFGIGITNPGYKLHVVGSVGFTSNISSTSTTSGTLVVAGGVGIGGSLNVNSASTISNVIINNGNIYGNLIGTATSSGYATTAGLAITSTYSHQSGYATTSGLATTASYAHTSGYGITAGLATTAIYSDQSGYGITAGLATTANYAYQSGYGITSGFATTSSYAYSAGYGITAGLATTANYAHQSGYGLTSGFATTSSYAYSSGYATTSGLATTANYAHQSGYGLTSGFATTATYSYQSGYAITSGLATSSYSSFINSATANTSHSLIFAPISGSSSGSGLSLSSILNFNPSTNILYTSGLAVTASTISSSSTTGALTVAGGLGVGSTSYFNTDLNVGNSTRGRLYFSQATLGSAGTTVIPSMAFIGATNSPITLSVLPDNSLSFDGSSGQLFSINNNLSTGWIFSINDISGLPIFRTNADLTVAMNEYGGNTGIGLSNPSYKLHVVGDTNLSSGSVYRINGVSVLSSSSLGTGITNSSLTAVGTITTGTWSGSTITSYYGGTGYQTYTTGDLLVGAGATLSKLPVGSNNTVLIADNTVAGGVKWGSISGVAITNINGLTASKQDLAIGYSGNVPSFASSGNTHTLNIPIAGSGSTGLVSTQAQTFAGQKTFTSGIVGDLTGTATTAGFASTASYAYQAGYGLTSGFATTASYAHQAGYAITSDSSGTAITATYAHQAGYAITSNNSNTSGYATTSGFATTASYAYQSGYGLTSGLATTANYAHQSGYAVTSDSSNSSGYATTSGLASTAIYAYQSGYGITAGLATTATYSHQSGYAITSGFATTANYAYQSGYGLTSGLATTANYAHQSGYAITSGFATTSAYAYQSGYAITSGLATSSSSVFINNASANSFHPIVFTPVLGSSSGAGLSTNSTVSYNPSTNYLYTSGLAITASTASTSVSTGALLVNGGVGISGQLTYNNALIGTTGISSQPTMTFVGANGDPIKLRVLDDSTLAFSGSQGQLFSISPVLNTGYIFSVNDISGVPLLRANADATVSMGEFAGNIGIGLSNPAYKLHVTGSVGFTASTASTSSTTGALVVTGGVGIGQSLSLAGRLQLFNGANYTAFVSSSTGNTVYTLPPTSPSTGSSVLQSNSAGVMSWVSPSGLGISVGGIIDGSVQYKSGSGLGGTNSLYFDTVSNGLRLGNFPGEEITSGNSAALLIEQAIGSFNGSVNGTLIAANASTGFAGDLINLQLNANTKFKVTSSGAIGLSSGITAGGNVSITSDTSSTSSSSGALVVTGGVGIGGSLNVNSASSISGVIFNSGTVFGNLTGTASTATYAITSGYGITSGFATTANYSDQSGYGLTSGFATTASYSYQSGYGLTSGFADTSAYSYSSGYGITAGLATTATYSYQSGYGITSGFATTSSYSYESGYGITSGLATTATNATNVLISADTTNTARRLIFSANGTGSTSLYNTSTLFVNPSQSSVGASVFTGSGSVNIRPGIDATSGVSIGNSSGSSYVYFDTINNRIGINQPTPLYDLHIVGELSATNKSFVIDHPTKPNMTLRHGSLEGPENGVYVRGKLINENIIELPDYWSGLVDDETITVSLTPIGKFTKLYVEKIENYKVYVNVETGNINCYFVVYGERKDIPKLDVEY